MSRANARFTQADVTRATKAAVAAGLEIGSVEVHLDGRIVVRTKSAGQHDGEDALSKWEESRAR